MEHPNQVCSATAAGDPFLLEEGRVGGDPGLPGYLLNLANGLMTLSEIRGDAAAAEEAVTVARRAVAACRPDGARRSVPGAFF